MSSTMSVMKCQIVSNLCPGAFVTKQMKQLQSLRYVLESDAVQVTLRKGKYECAYLDGSRPTVTFDKEPTLAYYREMFNAPRDYTNQVAVVEDTLRRVLHTASKTHPSRFSVAAVPAFKCKCCGHDNYIDCRTHYTCTKCAVVAKKIHQGRAYREMRERSSDMNGCGMAMNVLYSNKYNRQTFIKGSDKLERLHAKMSYDLHDKQIKDAQTIFEDTCHTLHVEPRVAKKALNLFCKIRLHIKKVRNVHILYAACLFHGLEEPTQPKRKHTSTVRTSTKKIKY